MKHTHSIGGYFGLEINGDSEYHSNAIRLNTARNCLRYLIRVYGIKEIYVPGYTCPAVWNAIEAEKCQIKFYSIGFDFMPEESLPQDSYILYTNYFGVCGENARKLSEKYSHLIIDNSQSFYSRKMGFASFNSARKFFGVPDGSYLFADKILSDDLEKDISWGRASHLLIRSDIGPQKGYDYFKTNEKLLDGEDIKIMSNLTQALLKGIDYDSAVLARRSNFFYLEECLGEFNEWKGTLQPCDVPMAYPFIINNNYLRKYLIDKKIFIPTYWDGQADNNVGEYFILITI